MAKLNQKEIKFFKNLYEDIYNDEEIKEIITEQTKIKTFIKELNRIEKKNGYEPTKIDLLNIDCILYEDIEYYIYDNDGKKGAQQYFNNRYCCRQ